VLSVLTYTTDAQNEGYLRLHNSCDKVGINLVRLGTNGPYAGHMTKFKAVQTWLHDCLSRCECPELTMFIDAHDTVVVSGIGEIIEAYATYNSLWVISAETNCAPYEEHATRYPENTRHLPYPYLNSGCWIGDTAYVLKRFNDMSVWRLDDVTNDQGLLTEWFLRHPGYAALDLDARVFQSMFRAEDHVELRDGHIVNKLTGSEPCIFHGNGSSSLAQVVEWAHL